MKQHPLYKGGMAGILIVLGSFFQWLLLSGGLPAIQFMHSMMFPPSIAQEVRSAGLRPSFQTGVIFPQWGATGYSDSDHNWLNGLNDIRAQTGARWVEVPLDFYQRSLASTDIEATQNTPSPRALAQGIRQAHALHFHVFVIPLLTVVAQEAWSGYIHLPNKALTQQWFENYWHTLAPYVQAADEVGAEQLAIGTEYEQLQEAPSALWMQLIERVRMHFRGELTYDMNWSSLSLPLPGWMRDPRLSAIGVSTYFPLVDTRARLEPALLPALWQQKIKLRLDALSLQLGKPVLISEIGYRASSDALYNPWERNTSASTDPGEQAAAYRAALSNILFDSHIQGVFFWAWSVELFAPNERPAAAVLHEWFCATGSQ